MQARGAVARLKRLRAWEAVGEEPACGAAVGGSATAGAASLEHKQGSPPRAKRATAAAVIEDYEMASPPREPAPCASAPAPAPTTAAAAAAASSSHTVSRSLTFTSPPPTPPRGTRTPPSTPPRGVSDGRVRTPPSVPAKVPAGHLLLGKGRGGGEGSPSGSVGGAGRGRGSSAMATHLGMTTILGCIVPTTASVTFNTSSTAICPAPFLHTPTSALDGDDPTSPLSSTDASWAAMALVPTWAPRWAALVAMGVGLLLLSFILTHLPAPRTWATRAPLPSRPLGRVRVLSFFLFIAVALAATGVQEQQQQPDEPSEQQRQQRTEQQQQLDEPQQQRQRQQQREQQPHSDPIQPVVCAPSLPNRHAPPQAAQEIHGCAPRSSSPWSEGVEAAAKAAAAATAAAAAEAAAAAAVTRVKAAARPAGGARA
jgi:hypothetical protein